MELIDKGFDLIEKDLKRLKKYTSIKIDLENYFKIHNNSWKRFGMLSCIIASGKNYCVGKQRIGIKDPKMSPSEGGRLWFVINKVTGEYYRCLLYSAKEESSYPKSTCFDVVNSQIRRLISKS